MRILVIGGGFVNKGAEAMVKTVQVQIGQRVRGAEFLFPASVEDGEFLRSEGISVCRSAGRAERLRVAARMAARRPRTVRDIMSCRETSILSLLEHVDAVLDISGYAYGDPWKVRGIRWAHAMVTYAKDLGKPYVFLPQAWGPFEREELKALCRSMCREARLAYARDDVSLEHIRGLCGGLPDSVATSPDIAFLFEGDTTLRHSAVLKELGFPEPERPITGVAPNMKVYERTPGTGMRNVYVRHMIDVCRHLADQGYGVLVFPHEVSRTTNGSTDDRLLCTMIEAGAGNDGVRAVTASMSARQMKSIIGGLKFVVGSRFHALIAGLSQGLPVMALSWSHKYKELLKPFGLEQYAMHYEDLGGTEQLTDSVSQFVRDIDDLALNVHQALPAIRERVTHMFDRVAAVLSSQSSWRILRKGCRGRELTEPLA